MASRIMPPPPPTCAIGETWESLKLLSRRMYNHDTGIFTFALPPGHDVLGLRTCACLLLEAPTLTTTTTTAEKQDVVVRPYTPVSSSRRTGAFDLLIKRYDEWGDPNDLLIKHTYRPAGRASSYIHSLAPGASVRFKHIAKNRKIPYPFVGVKTITMCAVGAGIAPMIQALHELLAEGTTDTTKIVLMYGSRSIRDILLRPQLDAWEKQFPDRFKVVHCIGTRWGGMWVHRKPPPPPEGFLDLREDRRELGWIDEQKLKAHAFPPGPATRVFVCGLPAVYESLCGPRGDPVVAPESALGALGYDATHVVKF